MRKPILIKALDFSFPLMREKLCFLDAVDVQVLVLGEAVFLDAVDVEVLVLGEASHTLPVHKVESLQKEGGGSCQQIN
jgi:hypothetical protein